jgi:carbamoyltransferase
VNKKMDKKIPIYAPDRHDFFIGINCSHDASVTMVRDGEIIYHNQDERILNNKGCWSFGHSLSEAYNIAKLNVMIVHEILNTKINIRTTASNLFDVYDSDIKSIVSKRDVKRAINPFYTEIINRWHEYMEDRHLYYYSDHHEAHAKCAFYNSGFDEAICLIIDGGGGGYIHDFHTVREAQSIFYFNSNEIEYLSSIGQIADKLNTPEERNKWSNRLPFSKFKEVTKHRTLVPMGKIFAETSKRCVGDGRGAGKLMGLSAYGKENEKIKIDPFVNGAGNFEWFENNQMEKLLEQGVPKEDLAYIVQKRSQEEVLKKVRYALSKKPNCFNICLSGGLFYNVINNYALLKEFPHINFWFEPLAGDEGVSVGCALGEYYRVTKSKKRNKLHTLYLGQQANYNRDLLSNEKEIYNVEPKDVAKLLAEKNVVALYQGKAEAGPRALGNRSILYDPRDPNGRDVVNRVKKREWYRPFAGTVLEEHASKWFDMAGQKSSPFMMFAMKCHEDKQKLVPALQHNDGTSRIQTLRYDQNANYYELIKEFYSLTGVPMVLNTSFNLAGDALVHDMERALETCRGGGIRYLYCPERKMLIDFTENL